MIPISNRGLEHVQPNSWTTGYPAKVHNPEKLGVGGEGAHAKR